VTPLSIESIVTIIESENEELWMKNRKTWFRVKRFEITKKYLKVPYQFMEATLTLASEPESVKKKSLE